MSKNRMRAARGRVDWDSRHKYEREYRNADEAEWSAFKFGIAHISEGTRDSMMAEEFTEQESDTTPGASFMEREKVDEGLQASVLEVIEERMELLGSEGYPFLLSNNSLTFNGDIKHPYLAFLTICNLPSITSKPYNLAPIAFEYLSLIAAQSFLGKNSKGWRFGWPRDNDKDLKIKDAAEKLKIKAGDHLNEWKWRPAEYLPNDPSTQSLKDAGLDFVAWVRWKDGGPAQLQLVGQCACGEDWKLKTHDLMISKLSRWMSVPEPPPVRALFTPRHTPFPSIHYKASEAGLIFDRIRIVHALMEDKRYLRKAQRFIDRIIALR